MRSTIFTLILVFTVSILSAQQFGGRNMGAGQQITGRLYGKILDSITGKPIEFVSVQLIQNKMDSVTKKRKDVVIGGMLTHANGDFSIENVPVFGPLKLKISAIGFKEIVQNVSFSMGRPANGDFTSMLGALDKDLGNIKIEVQEKMLENVTVQASGSAALQLAIDRKIFNVEKNIVSAGGTAVDVMRNIPSLSVDIDGNVTLRNTSPQIFVDGRPTTMTLDQIPADAIETVELITNPSAKFDASGGNAGILNVVLKKNRKVGYNGGLRLNADSRGRVGGGADINIRQNKINFFSSVNYFPRKSISTGTTFRNTFIDNPPYSYPNSLLQDDESVQKNRFMFVRAGFDYFVDNRNTISLSGSLGGGKFKSTTLSDLSTTYFSGPVSSTFGQRNSIADGNFNFKGFQGSFKHNFPKQGREWTADVTYNKRDNTNDNFIRTDYYAYKGASLDSSYLQRQLGGGFGSNLVVQTDFVNPLTDKSKLEAGLRMAYNDNNSSNSIYQFNETTQQYVLSSLLSSDFKSRTTVLAAYATYSSQIKNFGYQLGLRAESSTFHGEQPGKAPPFTNNFPVSFFPSAFISQKFKNDQELQLNYSRRINRPNFWQLFPFTDYSDSLNLSRGNPELDPEFTNSLELSYQKIFKNKDNLLASLYYKNTNNLITRNQVVDSTTILDKKQLINTYVNANSSYVTGFELTMKNKITKWWDLTSNVNLYTSKIKTDDPTVADQDQFFSWFGKINNNFKLPKNFTIQLSGEYQSRTTLSPGGSASRSGGGFGGGGGGFGGNSSTAQGYVKEYFSVDGAIRFDFLKTKMASVSLNVNDIFRTRLSKVHSESPFFDQDVSRRRDPQIFRLNLSWRFGKYDPSLFKRKNMKGEREASNIDSGMPGQ